MGKTYQYPPIVEALCDFRFEQNSWNFIHPLHIYEKIKNDYYDVKEIDYPVLNQVTDEAVLEKRIQFIKKDRSGIVQITKNLLSVHMLQPYTSWSEFFPEIKRIFNIYNEIIIPQKVNRIGLRYVNKIDLTNIKNNSIELKDYFNIYPFMGSKLPQKYNQFNTEITTSYEEDFLKIRQIAPLVATSDLLYIILDLDYFSTSFKNDIDKEEMFLWIENAHTNLEEAFESCITDKLRKAFKEATI